MLYTTPARSGAHTLRLTVNSNLNFGVNSYITHTYNAAGFSNPVAEVGVTGGTTLAVGSSLPLQGITRFAAKDPYAYTWVIDDSTVAMLVQDAADKSFVTLTGLKPGVVNLTMQDARYPNLSYTHTVVVDDVYVLSQGKAITATSPLSVGTKLALQAQLPQGISTTPQYTWSISDPSIASLDVTTGSNVVLKALQAGQTTLLLTDNSTGASTTISIRVAAPVTPPSGGAGGSTPVSTAPAAGGGGGGGGCLVISDLGVMLVFGLLLLGILLSQRRKPSESF